MDFKWFKSECNQLKMIETSLSPAMDKFKLVEPGP